MRMHCKEREVIIKGREAHVYSTYVLLAKCLQFGKLLVLGTEIRAQLLAILLQSRNLRLFDRQTPFVGLQLL